MLVGRDSSVGIATRYGLDGPETQSRWGVRFFAPVQTDPGVHPPSCTMGTGSFPRIKRPWCGVDHPPPSIAKVKERVVLYLYSPSGPSWPVLGWTRTSSSCWKLICRYVFGILPFGMSKWLTVNSINTRINKGVVHNIRRAITKYILCP
jgi:hypothetical protein